MLALSLKSLSSPLSALLSPLHSIITISQNNTRDGYVGRHLGNPPARAPASPRTCISSLGLPGTNPDLTPDARHQTRPDQT